jgi:hypothetical protein
MDVAVSKKELYSLVKKAVKEVLHEETLEFLLKNIATVSKKEMKEIERLHGKPSRKKDVAFSEKIEI